MSRITENTPRQVHSTRPARPARPAAPAQPTARAEAVQMSGESPYGDAYPSHVTVRPEIWSRLRATEAGGGPRNDHLGGILQNLGFTPQEVYGRAPNGRRMLDWVAETNGLRHPDLIHPKDNLVLPSRLSPEQLRERFQTAAEATQDPGLRAELQRMREDVERIADRRFEQRPVAVSGRDGEGRDGVVTGGDAHAAAEIRARQSIERSEITQEPQAEAGRDARAQAHLETGRLHQSTITQNPAAVGERNAHSEASVRADQVEHTVVQQNAAAEAQRSAAATSRVEARQVTESQITQTASAAAERAEANTQTDIGETLGTVEVRQSVDAERGAANTTTTVGQNRGDLVVDSDARGGGSLQQTVRVGHNEGSVTANLNAEVQDRANQRVQVGSGAGEVHVNAALEGTGSGIQTVVARPSIVPRWDRPREQMAPGHAELTSEGLQTSRQNVQGVQSATLRADRAQQDARLTSDAPDARYQGQENPRVQIDHRGHSGTVQASVQATERIDFRDEGAGPAHQGSRNRLDLELAAPRIHIGATSANSLQARTTGTAGDDRHEVMVPTRDQNTRIESALGAGDDRVAVAGNGNGATLHIQKTEGTLQVDMNLPQARGRTETTLDLGRAALTGTLETPAMAEQNNVTLRTQGARHNATITGGGGHQDTLTVEVAPGGRAPRVVTQEARSGILGFFRRNEEAVTPEGWRPEDGVIFAPGFERVYLRQGSS